MWTGSRHSHPTTCISSKCTPIFQIFTDISLYNPAVLHLTTSTNLTIATNELRYPLTHDTLFTLHYKQNARKFHHHHHSPPENYMCTGHHQTKLTSYQVLIDFENLLLKSFTAWCLFGLSQSAARGRGTVSCISCMDVSSFSGSWRNMATQVVHHSVPV